MSPFDEANKGTLINILQGGDTLLSLCHVTIDHAVQRLRVEGDEISVDVEWLAIDDEFEGGRGVDTARRVRESSTY